MVSHRTAMKIYKNIYCKFHLRRITCRWWSKTFQLTFEVSHYESRPKMHELFPCTAERLHPIKSVLLLQSGTYQIKKLALVIYKEDIMWALGQKQKRTNQSDLQNRKILLPLQLCFWRINRQAMPKQLSNRKGFWSTFIRQSQTSWPYVSHSRSTKHAHNLSCASTIIRNREHMCNSSSNFLQLFNNTIKCCTTWIKLKRSGGQFLSRKQKIITKLEKLDDRDAKELLTNWGFTFCKLLTSSVMRTMPLFPFLLQSCHLTMN
jgi:hypothetical protein